MWNGTIDVTTTLAQKLTYRILQISGASQQALDNYLQACKEKNDARIKADKELSNKVPWIRIILIAVGVIVFVLILRRFGLLRRRF